jgi:zinc/manganese transport system permease protein
LASFFVVLRAQVFAGDALSHVAFTGSAAALALGIDARIGLFAGCVAVGLGMATLDRSGQPDDVVVGTVFAWVLGLGSFFLTIYTTARSTGNGAVSANVLFGSVLGIGAQQATVAVAIGLGTSAVLLAVARPLLFASLDPAVARARGIPVRALGLLFLALVGVTAGEARQAVGALLVLGLLAAPAGVAMRLTRRPWAGLAASVGTAVLSVWLGLAIATGFPRVPASFAIMAVAAGGYLLAGLGSVVTGRGLISARRQSAHVPTISNT